jgi:SAM-dependent methyltransferase
MAASGHRSRAAEKAAALYDADYAARYRAHDDALPSSIPSQELASWLAGICGRFTPPIDALDLGCGTGRYFWALAGVRSLVGVDASPAMIAQARHPYRAEAITAATITLIEGDLLTQVFPAASFDLVYSVGVLAEHAPLTITLIADVARWLRAGGRFAFTAVHRDSPSVPRTIKRRLATVAVPLVPRPVRTALQNRLLSGGMYADEAFIRRIAAPFFTVESMDRFTSEAHVHVRAVLRKAIA